jgi:hypothetical protein
MSYNGYTNEATYFADLLVSNERKVYFAARAIAMEHRNPKVSGPLIHRLVTRTISGQNDFLTAQERNWWRRDIARSGGMGAVNWEEIADTQGEDRRRKRAGKLRRKGNEFTRGLPAYNCGGRLRTRTHKHPAHPYSHPVSRKHRRK